MVGFLLSFVNGMVIASARNINGRLALDKGVFKASLWNHLVGFICLSGILLMFDYSKLNNWFHALPVWGLLGGVFGACFVSLNSFILVHLGATRGILFVIVGQIISGLILDFYLQKINLNIFSIIGIGMILYGLYLSKTRK